MVAWWGLGRSRLASSPEAPHYGRTPAEALKQFNRDSRLWCPTQRVGANPLGMPAKDGCHVAGPQHAARLASGRRQDPLHAASGADVKKFM